MPAALRGHVLVGGSRPACPRKAVGTAPLATILKWGFFGLRVRRNRIRRFFPSFLSSGDESPEFLNSRPQPVDLRERLVQPGLERRHPIGGRRRYCRGVRDLGSRHAARSRCLESLELFG